MGLGEANEVISHVLWCVAVGTEVAGVLQFFFFLESYNDLHLKSRMRERDKLSNDKQEQEVNLEHNQTFHSPSIDAAVSFQYVLKSVVYMCVCLCVYMCAEWVRI